MQIEVGKPGEGLDSFMVGLALCNCPVKGAKVSPETISKFMI